MLLNSETILSVKLKPVQWMKKDFSTLQDCKDWCDDITANHKNIEIYRNSIDGDNSPSIFEDSENNLYYVFMREV